MSNDRAEGGEKKKTTLLSRVVLALVVKSSRALLGKFPRNRNCDLSPASIKIYYSPASPLPSPHPSPAGSGARATSSSQSQGECQLPRVRYSRQPRQPDGIVRIDNTRAEPLTTYPIHLVHPLLYACPVSCAFLPRRRKEAGTGTELTPKSVRSCGRSCHPKLSLSSLTGDFEMTLTFPSPLSLSFSVDHFYGQLARRSNTEVFRFVNRGGAKRRSIAREL